MIPEPQFTTQLLLTFHDGGVVIGEIKMFSLGDANKVRATIQPLDSKGNPVPANQIQGMTASVSDPTLLSLAATGDPMTFDIRAVGPLGTSQFQWSFDADPGTGVVTISGTVDIQVVPMVATTSGVVFGPQTPQ